MTSQKPSHLLKLHSEKPNNQRKIAVKKNANGKLLIVPPCPKMSPGQKIESYLTKKVNLTSLRKNLHRMSRRPMGQATGLLIIANCFGRRTRVRRKKRPR